MFSLLGRLHHMVCGYVTRLFADFDDSVAVYGSEFIAKSKKNNQIHSIFPVFQFCSKKSAKKMKNSIQ